MNNQTHQSVQGQLNMRFAPQYVQGGNSNTPTELLQQAQAHGVVNGLQLSQQQALKQQQQQQQQQSQAALGMLMSPQSQNRTFQQQQQQQQLLLQQLQQQEAVAALQAQQAQQQQQQQQQHQQPTSVREVWAQNMENEMMLIRKLAEKFTYVSVSTEFAGIVARPVGLFRSTKDYHYQTMRSNADILNLVQIGITLSDKNGKRPDPCTWQFNFKFDLENEMFSKDSIDALLLAGVNFNNARDHGIDPFEFAQVLTDSGLCLLDNVTWISYHAGYDFGFLISLLTNNSMPVDEEEFSWWLNAYFPNLYDIKQVSKLLKNLSMSKSSLEGLAEELGVVRSAGLTSLQTGGQSILSHLCFWEITRLVGESSLEACKNQIWGLSTAKDEVSGPGDLGLSSPMQHPSSEKHHLHQGGILSPRMGMMQYGRQL
ncbi:unnamed protein product [Kuraishia capsulata CBS 1993]|uniref:poly(A)-specific ribonuclease n=1 Tax=Kuraishia capsulata CBS 1993 TaxID=1382522 RepID=W6MQV0_9ASCO|nr:uncharacterized protein KUCA_T00004717001 [Kuraishia capsulata CBS 1993]CDK28733.1 unnamed protein product [Kuraishia capsulata CBS 1993]